MVEKNDLTLYLTPNSKITSKCFMELNVKCKIIIVLEENIAEKLCNTGFGNDFMDITPKAETAKENIDKLYSIKIMFNKRHYP